MILILLYLAVGAAMGLREHFAGARLRLCIYIALFWPFELQ